MFHSGLWIILEKIYVGCDNGMGSEKKKQDKGKKEKKWKANAEFLKWETLNKEKDQIVKGKTEKKHNKKSETQFCVYFASVKASI